jgi:hypothetical protein
MILGQTVKGYYEYAFSRYVDVVGLGIQGELFMACRSEISKTLKEEIGLTESDGKLATSFIPHVPQEVAYSSAADERCAILLEVDAENRERRLQLKKEKARIQEAKSWLEGLTRDEPDVTANNPFVG